MSIRAMSWVWEESQAEGTSLLVLLKIADHAGDDGRDAYPGQESLAKACRVSVRTVRRIINELVALGELTVEEYGGPRSERRGRRTHRYTLARYVEALSPPGLPDKMAANGEPGDGIAGHPESNSRTSEAPLPDTSVRGTISTEPSTENQDLPPATPVGATPTEVEPLRRGKPRGGWARIAQGHVLYEEAETVARTVWESMAQKPALEYTRFRGLVANFLDAGWSPELVARALADTRTFTVPAVEYSLRAARAKGSGDSRFSGILDQYRREEGIA